jgi:glyoxylase-like metal-dependent hydrolase (beta-lactamase superfamily II)
VPFAGPCRIARTERKRCLVGEVAVTENWQVYALRYGTHERTVRDNFLMPVDPHDGLMPLDFFVWLVRSADREIVIDTGFGPETARKRGRHISRAVGQALKALDTVADAVRDVVITHLHYDHAGNLDLFPNARFHLQDREMAFATGRHMCSGCLRYAFEVEDVVGMVRAVYADRVVFHDGDDEVAPGVTVHRVGGHTEGLQMVRVLTQRGPVVLASDASHYYANMRLENPYPVVFDVGAMVQGWRMARRLADGAEDRIIPGHDPEVRRRYPAVPGTEGETVVLHANPV